MASPEQERQARAAGYPSYDAMLNYLRRRSEHTGGTVAGQPRIQGQGMPTTPPQRAAPPPQQNNAMGWGPAALFNYIAGVMGGQR